MVITNSMFIWFYYGILGLGGWVVFLMFGVASVSVIIYDSGVRRLPSLGWKMGAILSAAMILPAILYRFTTDPNNPLLSPLAPFAEPIFYLGVLGGLLPIVLVIGYYVTFQRMMGCPRGIHGAYEAVLGQCPECTENNISHIVQEAKSLHPKTLLKIFLCHSSSDKPKVRELHQQLHKDGFSPWLDEEDLLPGQDWEQEIPRAVKSSDIVLVCLSKSSINKTGYLQKEIKYALDIADEQPDRAIFLIPVKLEECDVPERLKKWHWVNLFDDKGYQRLMRSLIERATIKTNS